MEPSGQQHFPVESCSPCSPSSPFITSLSSSRLPPGTSSNATCHFPPTSLRCFLWKCPGNALETRSGFSKTYSDPSSIHRQTSFYHQHCVASQSGFRSWFGAIILFSVVSSPCSLKYFFLSIAADYPLHGGLRHPQSRAFRRSDEQSRERDARLTSDAKER